MDGDGSLENARMSVFLVLVPYNCDTRGGVCVDGKDPGKSGELGYITEL